MTAFDRRLPPESTIPYQVLLAAWCLAVAAFLVYGLIVGLQLLLLGIGALTLLAGAYLVWQLDPAWTISAAVLLSPFAGNWQYLHLPQGVDPDRLLLCVGIIQIALRAPAARRRPRFQFTVTHLLMALALAYVVGSAAIAGTLEQKDPLFKIIDAFGLLPFLIFLVGPIAFQTERQRRILLVTLMILGVYLSLTAIFEVANVSSLVFPRYINNPNIGIHFGRGRGPFLDAVANGYACGVCAVAAGVAAMTWSRRRNRRLAVAVALLDLVGVLMSLERSVWIATGAGIITALLVARQTRRFVVPAVILGGAAVAVAVFAIPSLHAELGSRITSVRPIWDRDNLLHAGLAMVRARPLFGFGWETFPTKSLLYFQQSQSYPLTAYGLEIHNFLLGYAVELGLIGLALWLSAVLAGVGSAITSHPQPPDLRVWRIGLVAVAIMFAVITISVPPTLFPNLSLWLWAGVVLSARYLPRTVPRPTSGVLLTGRSSGAASVEEVARRSYRAQRELQHLQVVPREL